MRVIIQKRCLWRRTSTCRGFARQKQMEFIVFYSVYTRIVDYVFYNIIHYFTESIVSHLPTTRSCGNREEQQSFPTFSDILNRYLMKIDIKKTKVNRDPVGNIELDNWTFDRVHRYKYTGSTQTCDGRCRVEIRHGIAMAKSASHNKCQL